LEYEQIYSWIKNVNVNSYTNNEQQCTDGWNKYIHKINRWIVIVNVLKLTYKYVRSKVLFVYNIVQKACIMNDCSNIYIYIYIYNTTEQQM